MNRYLAIAAMLITVLLPAGPVLAQTAEDHGFLDDLVIDRPVGLNADEDADGIRLAIVSWGEFDEATNFTVKITEQPEFVSRATVAEGGVITFKPDEFEQLITLMLTLSGEGEGDLVLEVRPEAKDIQPQLRRIVLPLTRELERPDGPQSFTVCLADPDPKAPPPAQCANNVPLFPLDDMWVIWDTGFDERHSFQYRIIGPLEGHKFVQGRSESEVNSVANDSRILLGADREGEIRVQVRTKAQRAGEYTLQYRDQVKEVLGGIFGVGDPTVIYEGEWQDVGVYTVAPAIVKFKGFMLQPSVGFKTTFDHNGNIRPDDAFFENPEFGFEVRARWDYENCKEELVQQESTARIDLALPPALDLGQSLDPDSSWAATAMPGEDMKSSDYYREKSPASAFVPLAVNLQTLSQGYTQYRGCGDWGRVSFSLQFGDMHFTSRSVTAISLDEPARTTGETPTLLFKSPQPQTIDQYDYSFQRGHDLVRGPAQSIELGVRALVSREPVGDPRQRLGDYLRNPGAAFAIPVNILMTAWERQNASDTPRVGKPLTGFAIYGSEPGPYRGARLTGSEAPLRGSTTASVQPPGAGNNTPDAPSGSGEAQTGAATTGGSVAGTATGSTTSGTSGSASSGAVSATAGSGLADGTASGGATQTPGAASGGATQTPGNASGSATHIPGTGSPLQPPTVTEPTAADSGSDAIVQPPTEPANGTGTPSVAPTRVMVADVVGQQAVTARTALVEQGLDVSLAIGPPAPSAAQNDTVMSARPAPGTRVNRGDRVQLVVYSPAEIKLVVPNLVGTPAAMARAQLINEGFDVVAALGAPAPDKTTADTVERLRPAPGTRVDPGTAITMVIHAPPAAHTTGNVNGRTVASTNSGVGTAAGGMPADSSEAVIAENKPGYYVARIWGAGYRRYFGGVSHIYGEQIVVVRPKKGVTLEQRVTDWRDYIRGGADPCNPGSVPLCPCAPSPRLWQEGPFVEIIGGPYKGLSQAWDKYKCDKSNINTSMACNRWTSEPARDVALGRYREFRRGLGCPID
ncbi:MAG: PASTA domain-containing protein [Gammaproteobacteria bacterium]|nr:PASTA domain-containing protein [Gammaproteobacteria bacterium]